MEALLQVMAAKKREISAVQSEKKQKKEKYLRRAEVELILTEVSAEKETDAHTNNTKTTASPSSSDADQHKQSNKRKQRQEDEKSIQQQDEQGARKKQNQTADTQAYDQSQEEVEEIALPWAEMKKRLRELGEPITLFGETMTNRMKRLRIAEHDAAVRQEDELGEGHGIRNRFAEKQEEKEAADDAEEDDQPTKAYTQNNDKEDQEDDEGEEDQDKMVYRFFRHMLQLWEKDLANRPDHVKRTAQGKIATKTMKQCKDYIRPLFKLCKQRQVPPDILPNLVEIVRFCKQGEFVLANDAYIKLAIGNAAWPIGVTMVGIHERTGREKINSNKQAHVMNNEAQRKYLTSVKRLISYAQSIANVLPSKKVS